MPTIGAGITVGLDGVFRVVEADGSVIAYNVPETFSAALLTFGAAIVSMPGTGVDTNSAGYHAALESMLISGQALADKAFVSDLWQHAAHGESGTYDAAGLHALGLGPHYQITSARFIAAAKSDPAVLQGLVSLMDHGVTGAQIWSQVQHEAPGVAVELVGVPPA